MRICRFSVKAPNFVLLSTAVSDPVLHSSSTGCRYGHVWPTLCLCLGLGPRGGQGALARTLPSQASYSASTWCADGSLRSTHRGRGDGLGDSVPIHCLDRHGRSSLSRHHSQLCGARHLRKRTLPGEPLSDGAVYKSHLNGVMGSPRSTASPSPLQKMHCQLGNI